MNTQQCAGNPVRATDACPFSSKETDICLASLWSFSADVRRRDVFCATEDYDDCPIFLAKSLRRI